MTLDELLKDCSEKRAVNNELKIGVTWIALPGSNV